MDLGLDEVDVRHAAHEERGSVRILKAIHFQAKFFVQFRKLLEYLNISQKGFETYTYNTSESNFTMHMI